MIYLKIEINDMNDIYDIDDTKSNFYSYKVLALFYFYFHVYFHNFLNLYLHYFKSQGKFIEKLTLNGQKKSKDGSLTLVAEVSETGQQRGRYCVCIKMDLSRVNSTNIAILVYLDGGPRSFMHLSSVSLRCRDAPGDRG